MFGNKPQSNTEVPLALGDSVVATLDEGKGFLEKNKASLDEFILPSGIDASNYDHIEIFSKKAKYARTFYISAVPRMATFVEFLNSMYDFGDINVSVHIEPINEALTPRFLTVTAWLYPFPPGSLCILSITIVSPSWLKWSVFMNTDSPHKPTTNIKSLFILSPIYSIS